jgi:hypothetical protein
VTKLTHFQYVWAAGELTNSHQPVFVSDTVLDGADNAILRERFKRMREQDEIPKGIATYSFLVADAEFFTQTVVTSKILYNPKPRGDPYPWETALFIRAIDPNHDESAPVDLTGFKGEITIPLPKVFGWLCYCFFAKSEDGRLGIR